MNFWNIKKIIEKKLEKILEGDSTLLDKYDQFEKKIVGFIDDSDFFSILSKYADTNAAGRRFINFTLMENGFQPVVNGSIYSTYNNRIYKDFSTSNSAYSFYQKIRQFDFTDKEERSLRKYKGSSYPLFRRCLEGKADEGEMKTYKTHIKNIVNAINKNRIKEDIVLTRRMSYKFDDINSLNKWLNLREGDTITDDSFVSFSLKHEDYFGNDFSITLLAKKNDPVMNVDNVNEFEFLVQKGTEFKVLKKGLNSVIVEIV